MKISGICFAQSQSLIMRGFDAQYRRWVKINFNREHEANKDNRDNVLICTMLTTDVNNDSVIFYSKQRVR